jgi:carbonic anhydrase/acetyltransferase-like protein (isoleucine patch superfamily)
LQTVRFFAQPYVGDNTIVGMGAVVLNGANVGRGCIIGAGCVINENAVIPDHSLVVGVPHRVVRTDKAFEDRGHLNAQAYMKLKKDRKRNAKL